MAGSSQALKAGTKLTVGIKAAKSGERLVDTMAKKKGKNTQGEEKKDPGVPRVCVRDEMRDEASVRLFEVVPAYRVAEEIVGVRAVPPYPLTPEGETRVLTFQSGHGKLVDDDSLPGPILV